MWEADIGQLVEGKSYHLKRFIVREFELKKYVSKGQEGSITEIEDIGGTFEYEGSEKSCTRINKAQIVGVTSAI